jgi:hypothetical protein
VKTEDLFLVFYGELRLWSEEASATMTRMQRLAATVVFPALGTFLLGQAPPPVLVAVDIENLVSYWQDCPYRKPRTG